METSRRNGSSDHVEVVASGVMTGRDLLKFGLLLGAALIGIGAARAEMAAGGGIDGGGDVAPSTMRFVARFSTGSAMGMADIRLRV